MRYYRGSSRSQHGPARTLRSMLLLLHAEFLTSTAHYVTEAPLPQLWMQGSASEPAQVTQLPVPAEHAAWFDASEHNTACCAPPPAMRLLCGLPGVARLTNINAHRVCGCTGDLNKPVAGGALRGRGGGAVA
jgi:hypothetical protein